MLAALRPRMLELAAARAAGAHPYFVPVEHTAHARSILGSGPLLAPEVAVVLETDPARARELARGYAAGYLALPNYAQNLRDFGFGDDDIGGGGSDRLIDAVIPLGRRRDASQPASASTTTPGPTTCASRSSPTARSFPLADYRELAPRCSAATAATPARSA